MLFASYGIVHTEAEIALGCQTDSDGTVPSAVVRYAQSLGFDASSQRLVGLEALQSMLTGEQIVPIVYVHLAPLLGVNSIHAVLVERIEPQTSIVSVLDPAYPPNGRRSWPLALFVASWKMARYQVILVKSK